MFSCEFWEILKTLFLQNTSGGWFCDSKFAFRGGTFCYNEESPKFKKSKSISLSKIKSLTQHFAAGGSVPGLAPETSVSLLFYDIFK